MKKAILTAVLLSVSTGLWAAKPITTQIEREYLDTLSLLSAALLRQQNNDAGDKDYGGLLDPENAIYYSRAAEAVYPFTVMYQYTGNSEYRDAAIRLGEWLIRQQQPGGEWIENPWEWTGTTADQLIMLAAAFPALQSYLDRAAQRRWRASMRAAGLYLVEKMEPDFASINYIPTTAGALAVLWQNVAREKVFLDKAKKLAWQTVAKMDQDQFIHGEAARVHGVKYGVDLNYQMDMSLWGLTLYARITGDKAAEEYARRSLAKVIHFVYPNGIIDGSWGARSYKWTGYGTKTADGSQVLFSLFADENTAYQTASLRNLQYLRSAIKQGLVGYGRDIWAFASKTGKPNLYPTFARAKNLAMALEFGRHQRGPGKPLPADKGDWVRYFPSVKVGVIRQGNWMATVSAYDYHDYTDWGKGKYTHFPRGGAIVNLWHDGFGLLTTASQNRYHRGEVIHMPPIESETFPLTPRIEFDSADGYFTNLYETKAKLDIRQQADRVLVETFGQLSDQNYHPGGVAYHYQYTFDDTQLKKSVTLRYHDRRPPVRVIEPIVLDAGVKVSKVGAKKIRITSQRGVLHLRLLKGEADISLGKNAEGYWSPFPGLRTYPIVFELPADKNAITQTIDYVFETGSTR